MSSRTSLHPIYVNERYAGREVTGVERYAHEIIRRLGNRVRPLTPGRPLLGAGGHVWEQVVLPLMVSSQALLWSPANTGPLWVRNQVVTIHDVSVIEHPEWFNRRFAAWYSRLLPRLADRARRIITPSEFSRQRIMSKLHVPSRKIAIIPGGVDRTIFFPQPEPACKAIAAKYGLPARYILCVGTVSPRKNLNRLLTAWQGSAKRYPEYGLVIVGARQPIFRGTRASRSAPQVQWLGYVDDQDLPALYSAAELFVMPSLYEGFGLPVLEAMACGTPVIAARAGALPELGREAALLFDPENSRELAESVSRLIEDAGLRASLSEAGRERASHFSWEETTEEVWRVLESAGG
jgi:glycosyltransferase involved in cell wall biosynthesis